MTGTPSARCFTTCRTIDLAPSFTATSTLPPRITVTDMLRDLLAREFPQSLGDAS